MKTCCSKQIQMGEKSQGVRSAPNRWPLNEVEKSTTEFLYGEPDVSRTGFKELTL